MRTIIVFMSLGLLVMLSACSKSSNSPTQPSSSQGTVDWSKYGFTTVTDAVSITPGAADSVVSGPYDIQIPGNAFTSPVKFELLSGNPTSFSANAPSGETPILAFAFKVVDTQNDSLVGEFSHPVNITVTNAQITPQSLFYNILTNGSYVLNSTGMQVTAGQMKHPINGALYGWVITTPSSSGGGSGY